MAEQVLGRVLMNFAGDYDETKSYVYLDSVLYQGSTYVCRVDAQGVLPTDTSHWQLLARAGTDGDASSAMSAANDAKSQAQQAYNLASDTAVTVKKMASNASSSASSSANSDSSAKPAVADSIDTKNVDKNKMPADYSDGIFYEQKLANVVEINRSDYASDAQSGTTGILTTKAITVDNKKLARQRFELLDNDYPLTLERNGADSSWNDWHGVTNWN